MLALSLTRQPLRSLPIALAHTLLKLKPDDEAQPVIGRLYASLSPADQMRCRVELLECRAAKRGEVLASV